MHLLCYETQISEMSKIKTEEEEREKEFHGEHSVNNSLVPGYQIFFFFTCKRVTCKHVHVTIYRRNKTS